MPKCMSRKKAFWVTEEEAGCPITPHGSDGPCEPQVSIALQPKGKGHLRNMVPDRPKLESQLTILWFSVSHFTS